MFSLNSAQLSQPLPELTVPKNNTPNLLLKSKNCLQKVHSKLQTGKYLLKNGDTIKCLEQAARDVRMTINNKIQQNFNNILNQQTRVNLNDCVQADVKSKDEATKKLMQDYWNRRQQSQEESRRRALKQAKEKKFPKIKNSQNSQNNENYPFYAAKSNKKAIMSSLNVKIYEKQKQIQIQKKSKQEKILAYLYSYMVNVIDYKVQNDTPQFLLFQKFHYQKWDDIDSILRAVEKFCKKYDIKYCTLDLQRVMQLIQLSSNERVTKLNSKTNLSYDNALSENVRFPSRKQYSPHEILSCIEHSEQISAKNCKKSGIRFYGSSGKIRAVTKIQAVWKGKIVHKKIKLLIQSVKKVIKIQRAYRIHLLCLKTKQAINQNCQQKLNEFNKRQNNFRNQYRINELSKKLKYEIHICSDGQSQWQRLSNQKHLQKQNGYITRIFKAFTSASPIQTRIIFVTASSIPMQVMNYYNKLLELGGTSDYKNRIFFLSPQNCQNFIQKIPLARLLYYSPSVLRKISTIISDNYAYIVPSTPSIDYVNVCNYLNLPLYSSQPQMLLSLQTASGCKQFVQKICSQNKEFTLPYSKNIYNVKDLAIELTNKVIEHPHVFKWMLKIDNESNSRGLASIQVSKFLPKKMIKFMREIHKEDRENNKKYFAELTDQIFKSFFQGLTEGDKVSVVHKSVYKSSSQFLTFFYTNGGIIEAEAHGFNHEHEDLCFCVQIQPDNQWRFVNSYKKVTVKKRSVCCYFQSQLPEPPIQINQIIQKLIKKKCFGYFVFDFIKISNQKTFTKTYFSGMKCYLDHFSSASFMRQFISKQSNSLYIPFLSHPNIKKITIETFFHLCRLQNISFDIQRKIGNIFLFLQGFQSGCMGMMTFNDSSKIQTFIHAAQVLNFFTNKIDNSNIQKIDEDFLLLRNAINGYLSTLQKKKIAIKSSTQINLKSGKILRRASYQQKDYLI